MPFKQRPSLFRALFLLLVLFCGVSLPAQELPAALPEISPVSDPVLFAREGLIQSVQAALDAGEAAQEEGLAFSNGESRYLPYTLFLVDALLVPGLAGRIPPPAHEGGRTSLEESLAALVQSDAAALAADMLSHAVWLETTFDSLLAALWYARTYSPLDRELTESALRWLFAANDALAGMRASAPGSSSVDTTGQETMPEEAHEGGEGGAMAESPRTSENPRLSANPPLSVFEEAEIWYQEALGLSGAGLWVHWTALANKAEVYRYIVTAPRYRPLLDHLSLLRKQALEQAAAKALERIRSMPAWREAPDRLAAFVWPPDAPVTEALCFGIHELVGDPASPLAQRLLPPELYESFIAIITTERAPVLPGLLAPADLESGPPLIGRSARGFEAMPPALAAVFFSSCGSRLGIPALMFDMEHPKRAATVLAHAEALWLCMLSGASR